MKKLDKLGRTKLFRSAFASFLILLIIVSSSAPAFAISSVFIKPPSFNPIKPEKFLDTILKQMNISKGTAREVGQNMNVSTNKADAPEVKIFFTPNDPKEGEKLQAHAMPMYFKTTAKEAYYTWYLKHKECDLDDNPSSEERAICDRDNNGRITVNDWKVEAMRILAQGDHDTLSTNHSSNRDGDSDKDGFPQPDQGSFAKLGGVNGFEFNQANTKKCYVFDFASGTSFELTNGFEDNDQTGSAIEINNGYTATCRSVNGEQRIAACVSSSELIGLNPDSTDTQCSVDSQFSSSTSFANRISNVNCALNSTNLNSQCSYRYTLGTDGSTDEDESQPSCVGGNLTCPEGQTALCVKPGDTIESKLSAETLFAYDATGADGGCNVYNTTFNDAYAASCVTACQAVCDPADQPCLDACSASPACQSSLDTVANITCQSQTRTHSTNARAGCHHLFPEYNGYSGSIILGDGKQIDADLSGEQVGDGKFTEDEELFWNTSPKDPDSSDTGFFDESKVVGVGQDTFTWTYITGDKVGVAVEGESIMPTKYQDNSNMIMWALPNNKCPIPASVRDRKVERIKGFDVTIDTAMMDIDNCLEDNLVDPIAEGQAKKLEVEVSFTPENPMNDPTDAKGGDMLNLNAIVTNTPNEPNRFKYTWKIYLMDEGIVNGTPVEFTTAVVNSKLITGPVEGINLNNLKLFLNLNPQTLGGITQRDFDEYFPGGAGYIKAVVDIQESMGVSSGVEQIRRGKGTAIIKVVSTDKKISAYAVEVDDDGKINATSDEICDSDNPLCYVAKNDIVAAKLPGSPQDFEGYRWTLNDQPIMCDSSISNDCVSNGAPTNLTIFPIKGDVGDEFTLRVVAKEDTSKKNIELVKTFRVAKPFLEIAPYNADVTHKIVGAYVDLEGNYIDDKSQQILQVPEGKPVDLELIFHPESYAQYSTVAWALNGEVREEKQATEDTKFGDTNDANMNPAGSVINVEASATFILPANVRKALKNHWKISEFDTAENTIYEKVQIEVTPSGEALGMSVPRRMMASVISNASEYVLFLVKIILSAGLVLVVTGTLFSMTPGNEMAQERKRYY